MGNDADLLPSDLLAGLDTIWVGRRIYHLPKVDSTNRVAAELAVAGEVHGTIITTDFQTRGRGRHRRTWSSPPRRNLLLSLLLRPGRSPAELLPLSLAFSLAVAEALSALARETLHVKWPNDVVSSQGKLCGILAECSTRAGKTAYIVVGIGINVNMLAEEFPSDIRQPGSSLRTLTGAVHDRVAVLAPVLSALEAAYDRYSEGGFAAFAERYAKRLSIVGKVVEFVRRGQAGNGRVVGVGAGGELLVRLESGADIRLVDEEIEPRRVGR